MIGHYTALVWAESEFIGCATTEKVAGDGQTHKVKKNYQHPNLNQEEVNYQLSALTFIINEIIDFQIIICNYGKGGNIQTRPIYLRGTPASGCCDGMTQSTQYPNLCGN